MRGSRVWSRLLGVERTVVEAVDFDVDADAVIASVRPGRGAWNRCGRCGRRCAGYDRGEGRRRWRGLDLGTVKVFLEADAPRVACPEHGPTVIAVPWARHGARHTRWFEDTAAWLVAHTSKSAVGLLLRVTWRTLGGIVTRVVAEGRAGHDPLDGLVRIGIDEISYTTGQRYLTVVVDHDSGRLVWVADGHDRATLSRFFDELGETRCAAIALISADGAGWIERLVRERCPRATLCLDPFHVVSWATDCLDKVRVQAWNEARRGKPITAATRGTADPIARGLRNSRYALWKNPQKLTSRQRAKIAWIAKTDPRLHRAYLLKEGLRLVFQLDSDQATEALDRWLSWARRCRIPEFVQLSRRISRHRDGILAAITHQLSNALIESTNTKLRLLTRLAFGFTNVEALIALAMLTRGGYCPPLPGRAA